MTRNVWLGCELRQPPRTTRPGVQNSRRRSEEEEEACISSVKLAHSTIPRVERGAKSSAVWWRGGRRQFTGSGSPFPTWRCLVLGSWYLVVGAWCLLVLGTCSECSPLLLVTYQWSPQIFRNVIIRPDRRNYLIRILLTVVLLVVGSVLSPKVPIIRSPTHGDGGSLTWI